MKNKIVLQLFTVMVLFLVSCEKNTVDTIKPASNFANSPTCAYFSSEPVSGGGYGQFISFFDLSPAQTSDKKFFKVQLKFQGVKDSFEMVAAPQSMNNLGTGFPAEIREYPGYGWVNQWTNSSYRVLTSLGSYYKDTIVRNPASNIYFLHLLYQSGSLAGDWPQSNFGNFNEPAGINGQLKLHFQTIFYFKKGLCWDANSVETMASVKPIASFFGGAPNYDWQNVNSAIQISTSTFGAYNFYFLDFKNWRYFKWHQFMNNIFSPAQLATSFGDYESLDNLIKWPEGWGKK